MKTIRFRGKPAVVYLSSEVKDIPEGSVRQSVTDHIDYLNKKLQENQIKDKWNMFTVPYTIIKTVGDGIHSNDVYYDTKDIIIINDENKKIQDSKHVLKSGLLHEGIHISGRVCKYRDESIEEGAGRALQTFYIESRDNTIPGVTDEECDKVNRAIYECGKGLDIDKMKTFGGIFYRTLGELGEEVCTTLFLDVMNREGNQIENYKENISNYKLNLQHTFG